MKKINKRKRGERKKKQLGGKENWKEKEKRGNKNEKMDKPKADRKKGQKKR